MSKAQPRAIVTVRHPPSAGTPAAAAWSVIRLRPHAIAPVPSAPLQLYVVAVLQGKLYLAAGGLGGIIGDGQLPNAGPEQILEVYYRVPVFSFAHLTVDYQFINHPAYNRERGPVSIFGLRTRVQF